MSYVHRLSFIMLLFSLFIDPIKAGDEKSCPQLFPGARETGTIHEQAVGMIVRAGILQRRKFTIVDKSEAQAILDKYKGVLFTFKTLYSPKCGFEFSIQDSEDKSLKERIIGYFED